MTRRVDYVAEIDKTLWNIEINFIEFNGCPSVYKNQAIENLIEVSKISW